MKRKVPVSITIHGIVDLPGIDPSWTKQEARKHIEERVTELVDKALPKSIQWGSMRVRSGTPR